MYYVANITYTRTPTTKKDFPIYDLEPEFKELSKHGFKCVYHLEPRKIKLKLGHLDLAIMERLIKRMDTRFGKNFKHSIRTPDKPIQQRVLKPKARQTRLPSSSLAGPSY